MSFQRVDIGKLEDIRLTDVDRSILKSVSVIFRERIEEVLQLIDLSEDQKESFMQNSIYLNLLFYFYLQSDIKVGESGYIPSRHFAYSVYGSGKTFKETEELQNKLTKHGFSVSNSGIILPVDEIDRYDLVEVSSSDKLKRHFLIIYQVYKTLVRRNFKFLQDYFKQLSPDSPILKIRL